MPAGTVTFTPMPLLIIYVIRLIYLRYKGASGVDMVQVIFFYVIDCDLLSLCMANTIFLAGLREVPSVKLGKYSL